MTTRSSNLKDILNRLAQQDSFEPSDINPLLTELGRRGLVNVRQHTDALHGWRRCLLEGFNRRLEPVDIQVSKMEWDITFEGLEGDPGMGVRLWFVFPGERPRTWNVRFPMHRVKVGEDVDSIPETVEEYLDHNMPPVLTALKYKIESMLEWGERNGSFRGPWPGKEIIEGIDEQLKDAKRTLSDDLR